MTTNPKQIEQEARAFRVWREGRSVKWDCTAADLAEATGESIGAIRAICRRRGWSLVDGRTCETDQWERMNFVPIKFRDDAPGLVKPGQRDVDMWEPEYEV